MVFRHDCRYSLNTSSFSHSERKCIACFVSNMMNLTISADALHPNNNAESVNIGAALDYKIPGFGQVSLTSGAKNGMKSINSDRNDFSITFGIGAKMFYLANKSLSIDYTYKPMGILGNVQMYTVGVSF